MVREKEIYSYKIRVEETKHTDVWVDAEDESEAIDKVRKMYDNYELDDQFDYPVETIYALN